MKKIFKLITFCILVSLLLFISINNLKSLANNDFMIEDKDLIKYSKSAIAIETKTRKIMFEHNSAKRLPPASTTKIMTIKLVLDALKNNVITYDQIIETSKYASSMGGSQIFLSVGEKMSVADLLKAVVVASANDAAVALSEAVAGSERAFVKKMNEEAKRLKMIDTNYENVTGLHSNKHFSSAKDLAIIASELINEYEDEIIPLTSLYEDYLRKDTNKPFWLVNTNKLIKGSYGIDGLKTGWTNEAGYCLVATKKQKDMRVITVVMGADTISHRNDDTIAIINEAFANFELKTLVNKGDVIKVDQNVLYTPLNYKIVAKDSVVLLTRKGIVINNPKLVAKIKSLDDSIVGELEVYIDNELYDRVDLILGEKVTKKNFLDTLIYVINEIL